MISSPVQHPHRAWKVAFLAIAALAFYVTACSTVERVVMVPPEIPGASYVGNKTCYECHTNISRHFAASAHARVHSGTLQLPGGSGCEACHGPGSKHIAAGGGRGVFIVNPRQDAGACFQCHLETHAEFNLPHHHPVAENKMNCVQCHDPHGRDIFKTAGGLAMARLNQTCAACHREQTRPAVFEHEAMREGCTTCHTAHGSVNAKLLTVRDSNLCLSCHFQQVRGGAILIGGSDHTARMQQGTCWTAGCHEAIHGSRVNPSLKF